MKSTKTVSLRVDYNYYNYILLECEKKEINISEWIERKLAIAENLKDIKNEILDRLESILATETPDSEINKIRLRKLMRLIEQEL